MSEAADRLSMSDAELFHLQDMMHNGNVASVTKAQGFRMNVEILRIIIRDKDILDYSTFESLHVGAKDMPALMVYTIYLASDWPAQRDLLHIMIETWAERAIDAINEEDNPTFDQNLN
jgi:hypothetical protein